MGGELGRKLRALGASLAFCVLFHAAMASAADFTSPIAIATNATAAYSPANITVSFTLPNAYNYTNVSIEFPSGFSIAGAGVFNNTALPSGSFASATAPTGQINGRNASFIINNSAANASGIISLNFTNVLLSKVAASYLLNVYAVLNDSTMPDGPNATITGVIVTAGNMVNLSMVTNTAQSQSSSTYFNITAYGQDEYGNLNNSGVLFASNNASVATPADGVLGGGNGTTYLLFNASFIGSTNITAWAARNSSLVNATLNVTVSAAGPIAIVNATATNGTASNASGRVFTINASATDLAGNVNNSGGFRFASGNATVAKSAGNILASGNSTRFMLFNASMLGITLINVTSVLNPNAANASVNLTVNAPGAIAAVNVSTYPVHSNSSATPYANATFNVTVFGIDAVGNVNNSGGFNFYSDNLSIAAYVSGNGTLGGLFNASGTGTAAIYAASAYDAGIFNYSIANSTKPPLPSRLLVTNINATSATINWVTDEAAVAWVEYGPFANFTATTNTTRRTTYLSVHAVAVNNLSPRGLYYYRVWSGSAYNLNSSSLDTTSFITAAADGTIAGSSSTAAATPTPAPSPGSTITPTPIQGIATGVEKITRDTEGATATITLGASLSEGSPARIALSQEAAEATGVLVLVVTPRLNTSGLNAIVTRYAAKPEVLPAVSGREIAYWGISLDKPAGFADSVLIAFAIPKSQADAQDVLIAHFEDGKWVNLPVKQAGEDENNYFIAATTASLSPFAAYAKEGSVAPKPTSTIATAVPSGGNAFPVPLVGGLNFEPIAVALILVVALAYFYSANFATRKP